MTEKSGESSQTEVLIELARQVDLFHTPEGVGFADVVVDGYRKTFPTRGKRFQLWLMRAFFDACGGAPSAEALRCALGAIDATAKFDSPEERLHVRVAEVDRKIFIDLADETWRAVEVDRSGWRIADRPPVRFWRAPGMGPLPVPERGGSIGELRKFLNLTSEGDTVLTVAWLLAALRGQGPYPVLALSGEQGSAKSTFCAILRALIDPNAVPLRALPRGDRDLFIAANNAHLLAFDNVSSMPPWLSDALCRLATGGGFAVRQLRTDCDEVLFDAARPILLNGIEDIVTRPDLADRAIFLTFEAIPDERRRPERELRAAFETERPRILGALLDIAAHGLAMLPRTELVNLPRMADFALWVTACESAIGPPGAFAAAYNGNRARVVEDVIDADAIATALCALMEMQKTWAGTASKLLHELTPIVDRRVTRSRAWPSSPRAFAGRLRRAATFLRKIGVDVTFAREGRAGTRMIHLARNIPAPHPEHAVPASSPTPGADAADADGLTHSGGEGDSFNVSVNQPEINELRHADDTDAAGPTQEEDGLRYRASKL
jgi:hypothetical protein